MKYCIDSCSLIDLGERYYPESVPVFSPIWDYVYGAIECGELISVDYVKVELESKADDWRTKFLEKTNGMFQISQQIEHEYASVVQEIEKRKEFVINKHRDRFMNGADPWLVALVRSMPGECTLVSSEIKTLTNYGLRAVSDALGVPNMNLLDLFQAQKIGA